VLVVLAAWAALAGPSAAQVSPPATDRPSAGCQAARQLPGPPGATSELTLEHGGLERTYRLHLPTGYDSRQPRPLVLVFHGYTGTSAGIEQYTELSRLADENSFVAVYPQSTGFAAGNRQITSWNDLAGSASPGPEGPTCAADADPYPSPPECGAAKPCVWASCHDDVGFVEQLLDDLENQLCLDLDRIYATGMSNGGMFVHRLGCAMPERLAAIAPVSGTLARGFNCAPPVGLSLLNVNGARDDYVSQAGDKSSDGYYYTASSDVLDLWAGPGSQTCGAAETHQTAIAGIPGLRCIERPGCATGAAVVHCDWDGAHDWPGSADNSDSPPNPAGSDLIWQFFAAHSRASYRH
jgi:polyhydroxybutyrate depolymerase